MFVELKKKKSRGAGISHLQLKLYLYNPGVVKFSIVVLVS